MKIITICQKKGGNGKSTSCQNLAASFAAKGKRVLVVDLDEQGNTSSTMGILRKHLTVDAVLAGEEDILFGAALPVWDGEGVCYLGTRGGLSGVMKYLDGETGGHLILKERLAVVRGQYDYCFIDTAPSMNILTLNALCASDGVFIPLSSKYFSLKGLVQTMESIEKVQKRLNEKLRVLGMAFVIHDGRSGLASEVIGKVKEEYGELVFQTIVNQNIRIEEVQVSGRSIIYADRSDRAAFRGRCGARRSMRRWRRNC
ncbi:AAA family ATPase [Brucepastera parasyntrophica]|uniref:ParA family protein n=1 Tax=Brucepastera parasyntrophica TaxID=2880008 RepID=UPI00210B661D|nr:ParA family protein [Brucepastera parasyntrophica]ULQ59101.1 AAA family ATPase [Brucepastera parasyntrophica]